MAHFILEKANFISFAQSKADFISKMQIDLKECHETEYWLKLFSKTKIITDEAYKKTKQRFWQAPPTFNSFIKHS